MAREKVAKLKLAESPHKEDMISVLDAVKKCIEDGEVVALAVLQMRTGETFSVKTCGKISKLEMIGLLEVAKTEAVEATGG